MYQLKITLRDSKPPIWRRVVVPEQIPLSKLHQVIQLAFGWNDEHLYMFEKGRRGDPGSDFHSWGEDLESEGMKDATITPLWASLQSEGEKLIYTYDFGDWWDCIVLLEKQTQDTNQQSIMCLRGKGTTPTENSGGLPGYNELLLQARRPGNPEQVELHSFLMQDIEKRDYDLIRINERLQVLN
ncbi:MULTISPECIES: plasmid pRiA4b ORF-3 family protein [unclassified Serratia (in: enterobacteria)]|uniref:plasmid pRiA4b ORF-3 family protein n=1 Tax=unclassified Serratia (in: enterobacteria) TaxID=2647522 RepID=UPI00046AD612|nr:MULTISPECIES: plasmid pRiA4b ORF-3 family protein [unclassified Serratia (in: enterobacteria)]